MKGVYTKEELATLYRRRVGMVYQICLMLLKNVPDAEDAAQTVFRKVLERGEPFRDLEHEKAWLIVTARNECKKEELEAIPWEQPGDGEIWQELLALPERERTALYLYYYQGYTTEETAELMGTKPATLRTWLFRARGKLKQRLEAEGYGI